MTTLLLGPINNINYFIYLTLDSEQSDKCTDFTMYIFYLYLYVISNHKEMHQLSTLGWLLKENLI